MNKSQFTFTPCAVVFWSAVQGSIDKNCYPLLPVYWQLTVYPLTTVSQNSICSNHKWHELWQSYQQGRNYMGKGTKLAFITWRWSLYINIKCSCIILQSFSWRWLIVSAWISRIITDSVSKAQSQVCCVSVNCPPAACIVVARTKL